MIIDLSTKRVYRGYHSNEHSYEFYPCTRRLRQPAGVDTERNYVTVTPCKTCNYAISMHLMKKIFAGFGFSQRTCKFVSLLHFQVDKLIHVSNSALSDLSFSNPL